jgi:hypothetical protein
MHLARNMDAEYESTKPLNSCRKVLEAGIWLLQNGFGRMQLLPYVAPSGCYWRCEFHPPGRPSLAFYKYTTGCGTKYLANHCGGSVRSSISPKTLAQAIIRSVPEDAQMRCSGSLDLKVADWIQQLDHVLERDLIPAAFDEMTTDYSRWDLYPAFGGGPTGERFMPQPGYVQPGEELHWSQTEFWPSADREFAGALPVDLAQSQKVDLVASKLWEVMREVSADDASSALRAAISLLTAR